MPELHDLATKLKNGEYKNVVFMVGAGISTAAGIPDFRSPGTGLYSNLQRLNLPYPEAVFDISYFRKRPEAFYTLADELFPTKFKPTLFHVFIRLVDKKGFLRKVFTQNIDTLERLAGVDGEKVIEAHGSFAKNHCIDCHAEVSTEELQRQMYRLGEKEQAGEVKDEADSGDEQISVPFELKPGQKIGIPQCNNPYCAVEGGGLVKPDIVFFGEGLPEEFFEAWENDLPATDLAIVAGTSLTVGPFNRLPEELGKSVPRLLFNMEEVGDLGERKNDVLSLGPCDEQVRKFAQLCGWEQELDELVKEVHDQFDKQKKVEAKTEEPTLTSGEASEEDDKDQGSTKLTTSDKANEEKKDNGDEVDELADKLEKLDKL